MFKKILIVTGLIAVFQMTDAQEDLKINDIFDNYGKQQGSILIELAKDVLGYHTNISKYKSLILAFDNEAINNCIRAVQSDISGGKILIEKMSNGKIETACYCLRQRKNTEYEYILFNVKAKKMTLIYIKGKFEPQNLENEIGKLKNLFIKVNGKHIKL